MRDRLSWRRFRRAYLNDVPVDAALLRWSNLIQSKTLEKFNERIVQLAVEQKVTRGRKLRTDGTVVESNICPPSDHRLLADGVRVLERTVVWARCTQTQLDPQQEQKARRLAQTLEIFLARAEQVIDYTTRRILQDVQIPALEKSVSLFEEHTDIIRPGKQFPPVEYGHKVWLNEVEGGLVSHYRVLQGKPGLKAHLKTFHQPPQQVRGDRGLSERCRCYRQAGIMAFPVSDPTHHQLLWLVVARRKGQSSG